MQVNSDTVVVTVSYNTAPLTALLVWSLHRVLVDPVGEVVVVDNASTDGSIDLLRDLERAGVCTVLCNDRNVGHGPALNQAVAAVLDRPAPPQRMWILDSDCVVTRSDVLARVVAGEATAQAAIVGEGHWDPWHGKRRLELYSMILDQRAMAVVASDTGFADDGDPSIAVLDRASALGLTEAEFPFTADGFIIHRGRGTLAAVATAGERDHPLYDWALTHCEPHFGGVPGAAERYSDLLRRFGDDLQSSYQHPLLSVLRRSVASMDDL